MGCPSVTPGSEGVSEERQGLEEARGTVLEVRPKALFRVRLEDGSVLLVGLSPTQRHSLSRLVAGDQVLVRRSPLDPHRGQIIGKAQ